MSRLVLSGGKIDDYGNDLMFYRILQGDVADGLAVVANSAPAMNVYVQPGTGRVPAGTAPNNYSIPFAIDTGGQGEQVTIATANSSNPRNDLIVAVVNAIRDTSLTNNVNISLSLLSVAGTPASSPSDPNASAIQAAITAAGGSSSDRYVILGRVRVSAGVTQITSSDITDLRQMISTTHPANSVPAPAMVGIRLFARGGGYSASPPPAATGQFYVQAGSTVVNTNANGDFTVTFPTAFGNGLLSVVICDGDDTGNPHINVIAASTNSASFNGSSSKVSTVVRVNWIAIGW